MHRLVRITLTKHKSYVTVEYNAFKICENSLLVTVIYKMISVYLW